MKYTSWVMSLYRGDYIWTRPRCVLEEPTKVTELRSLLGLAYYYHRFISSYSAKAAPLSKLLKKNKPLV